MDKRSKKADRPKLRKEDIGIPVNFVHLEHIGFGGQKRMSQSACTTPAIESLDPFNLAQQNNHHYRRSDSSMTEGKYASCTPSSGGGKENRFSLSGNMPSCYTSMADLTSLNNKYEKYEVNRQSGDSKKFAGIGKPLKPAKTSFSGSLLNLAMLPFSKGQDKDKSRASKSEHDTGRSSARTKRLSLGLGFPSSGSSHPFSFGRQTVTSPPTSPPPPSPTVKSTLIQPSRSNQVVRRRTSSFNGESDAVMLFSSGLGIPPRPPTAPAVSESGSAAVATTLTRYISNKKPKMVAQLSLPSPSPPMSPTYDELPPPPLGMMDFQSQRGDTGERSPLPTSPSYIELPPPPMKELHPMRKISASLPPPPPPPTKLSPSSLAKRRLSAIPYSPPPTPVFGEGDEELDLPPPPLPLSPPPPSLPVSPPPFLPSTSNRVGYNLNPMRAKLVRVNAPTLPPLSVPLVRDKSMSQSPSTWPLEPSVDTLHSRESSTYETISDYSIVNQDVTVQAVQELCHPSSSCTSVGYDHVEPLSKLFQCRLSIKQWPAMMTRLFANSANKIPDAMENNPSINQEYNNLIKNSLRLWLSLEGGAVPLEDVVAAFEQAQVDLKNKDADFLVTKL